MNQTSTLALEHLKEMDGVWRAGGEAFRSRVSDLSRTGAFVKTPHPAGMGCTVELRLEAPGRQLYAQAVVCRVEPGAGMAIEFQTLTPEDRRHLDTLVQQIEMAQTLWVANPIVSHRMLEVGTGATRTKNVTSPPPRNRRIERRSRIRLTFTATITIVGSEAASPLNALVSDLGAAGCSVRLAKPFPLGSALKISIAWNKERFRAQATVASMQPGEGMGLKFTGVDSPNARILEAWLTNAMERHWLASNRRKNQRVLVNLPVQAIAKNSMGTEISEETTTVAVSPHGALLHLEMNVMKGQKIFLFDPSTDHSLECSVDYIGAAPDGRREVGVSFVLHNRTLWNIAFPVEWSPDHKRGDGD